MFTNSDLELFEDNYDTIEKKLLDKENEILYPTLKMRKEMENIVINFVKSKRRKIYGGTAQNALIKNKDKSDAFYEEDSEADIDFYSPEPISDAMELCNIFVEKGYKNVEAREAQHKETYSVFVEFINKADISYIPKNIYHKMPFIEINGLFYTGPTFIMIDMYRMLTDPVNSGSFRWKKTLPRIVSLQKHYPFNKASSKLPKLIADKEKDNEKIDKYLRVIFDFLKNKDSMALTGDYAYNQFLKESDIMKDKNKGQKYRVLDISKYEIISTNYEEDVKELFQKLKSLTTNPVDFTLVEYYPFWMFLGYSVEILYDGKVLAHIMNYDKRCIPIKKIKLDKKDYVQIGSYDYNFLTNIIMSFRHRVNDEKDKYQYRNIMTSHLIEMRNYFFKNSKKTFLDDTLFQQFIVECIGETISPARESRLCVKEKIKKGKRAIWSYRPETDGIKDVESNFIFMNTSGNIINNINNLKIIGK